MSFDLLSEPIRKFIRDKGWEQLRPIQTVQRIQGLLGENLAAVECADVEAEVLRQPPHRQHMAVIFPHTGFGGRVVAIAAGFHHPHGAHRSRRADAQDDIAFLHLGGKARQGVLVVASQPVLRLAQLRK